MSPSSPADVGQPDQLKQILGRAAGGGQDGQVLLVLDQAFFDLVDRAPVLPAALLTSAPR